jgi:sugar phosphate isomerase/epimerase
MFDFGVEALPWHDCSLETTLREAASLGFRSIDLWSSKSPPLAHHLGPDDDPARVRALLEQYGLRPSALTTYVLPQKEIARRIEFAAQLGIDTVIFDCEANLDEFIGSFLPPLLDLAAGHGIRIAVENHLTVKFTDDFEAGGTTDGELEKWDEGIQSIADMKRLLDGLDHPNLGICLAPPHMWAAQESVVEAIEFLAAREKLFFYYVWDIDAGYRRGVDGLNFGPAELQLPRPDGTLDHRALFDTLEKVGYEGVASLKCHGTAGWETSRVTAEVRRSAEYVRGLLARNS